MRDKNAEVVYIKRIYDSAIFATSAVPNAVKEIVKSAFDSRVNQMQSQGDSAVGEV